MLNLKLQYFGHLMQRPDSLEKILMLGKIEGRRRRAWWRMRWLDASPTRWTWVWASSRRWWRAGKPGVMQSMGSQRVGYNLVTEQLQQHKGIYHNKKENIWDFPSDPMVKNPPTISEDMGSTPDPGRFHMPQGNYWDYKSQLLKLQVTITEACMPLAPVFCNKRSHWIETLIYHN